MSESSPHLFPAPPTCVPPNMGWHQQYRHPLLSKKTLEAGAVEYNGTLCPKLCPSTRHLYRIPQWEPQEHRGPPASLPRSIQGEEYSSGQESAFPAIAWVQPGLQDPPWDTHKGPGNGLLKAESFPGFQKDAWYWAVTVSAPMCAAHGSVVKTQALETETTSNSGLGI